LGAAIFSDQIYDTLSADDHRYFAAHVARTREPIYAPDVAEHDIAKTHRSRIKELGLAAVITWPILGAKDVLLGVINLASRKPKDIGEVGRVFFETVAGMFATVLERRRAEDKVRVSESKHRLLLESIGSPVLALDRNMNILYYNDAYAACADLPRQGMEGKNLLEAFPSFAENESRKAYAEALSTGTPQLAEVECCERYFRMAVYPMPWGILAVATDITERKCAEEALRESEERYRVLFEGGNDAVFVFNVTADGKPGKFVEVNNEACQYLGYSAAELHELTPADLVPPERRKAVAELMRRLVEERELIFEWAHLRKDGAEIPVEISSHLFEFRGEPTAISIVRDITERIRAEEALRKSEQEVRGAEREKTAILSSMSEHVVYHDKELKILWANEAASSSVGLSPEGLIGRHCYEVWHDRKQPCENCPVAAAIETGGPHEEEVTTPDGRSWFIRGYPIKDEGGDVTNAVEVTLEITDRKRAEDDLKHALAENEALLEAVPDLMFVVDKEGNYVDFKRVEADMFALPPETIIGKNVRDTGFTAEDERKVFAGIERTLRTGETTTVHYELEVPRGRGAFEARIVKLNDDEVLAVVRETTPPETPGGD